MREPDKISGADEGTTDKGSVSNIGNVVGCFNDLFDAARRMTPVCDIPCPSQLEGCPPGSGVRNPSLRLGVGIGEGLR